MIVDYIDAHKSRFGVDPIARVLSEHGVAIAPSTYYAARKRGISAAVWADAHNADGLFDLWTANRGVYGVRKLWLAARRAGHDLGRDQVARLMRLAGIDGVVRGRRTTITTERGRDRPARHPDLIGRAWSRPTRPDQWWVADFTYCWTLAGFCYTAFCVDVYSRRILGWRVMTSKTTPLVTSVLEQALFTRRRTDFRFTATGLIHHSDAGAQGGFNWSSQHLDRGGVQQWRRRTGSRRRARFPKGLDGSGVRIGRCGPRCVRLGGLSPRGRCSGSSGV